MRIIVVGGMNLDLLGMPTQRLLPGDSTPGKIVMRPGGVGRNIAARLRALGAQVSLVTALGADEKRALLEADCRARGIDLSMAVETALPTPSYLCVHDETGDMVAGVNDMSAMACVTPEALEKRLRFDGADGCVLDANLPEETLAYLTRATRLPIGLDPVSCAKAPRVTPLLPLLAAVKPNWLEAKYMTGEETPEAAAQALHAQGAKRVFISMGAKGVYYLDDTLRGIAPAKALPHTPLTGAGDACCAGLTMALLRGEDARACAEAGCRAAYDALMRED